MSQLEDQKTNTLDLSNTLTFTDEDLPYEEEILRNPASVKHWLRYIEFKENAPAKQLNVLYERALKELPRSYKLWHRYLTVRREQIANCCPVGDVRLYADLNRTFERSLVFMHTMPRIWLDYCEFLTKQTSVTRCRHVFDRSLRSLPITQHNRVWPLYLEFVRDARVPTETAVRVFRRHLKLSPENAEDYVDYLLAIKRLDEAAQTLARLVNTEKFTSQHGKSKHQLWNELCDLISNHPGDIKSLDVDAIIRGGLRRYTDQLGHLWNSLATYYIRSGLFERARDIYEEAIGAVLTVRDFTQIFDAYAQFEELTLSREMAAQKMCSAEDEQLIEMRLLRFERLMERRPLLLNSVLLRQNPHNVPEWHKRVQLYEDRPLDVIRTYQEAVRAISPKLAVGQLYTIWVAFAKFYEQHDQLEDARLIFRQATLVDYTKIDDLATVWCEWAEMELRCHNYDGALKLIAQASAQPARKADYFDESVPVQARLYKSLKIWSMYADLEESFGTFQTCKAVYEQMLELRIATPQIIINYGLFLEEHGYFEEAFRAYEKGIALFRWPNVFDIWSAYLTKFLTRYGGAKLERARDLFEQCLDKCPAAFTKHFYVLYAKLEEDYGMARHAMAVYERATAAVPVEEQFSIFELYLERAAEIYGVPRTREIFQRAIEALPEWQAREMCMRFAEMETKLGEVDRARAIYTHCSQMCDPRVSTMRLWPVWKEFEVRHGNEDTMREMLRIKRQVYAMYNTQVNVMSAQMLAATTTASTADAQPVDGAPPNTMHLLESKVLGVGVNAQNIQFVRGETQSTGNTGTKVVNPDEIDIDGDDDDGEEVDDDVAVEKQTIPSAVFGNLQASTSATIE